ncbi:hypothetical protein [Endozoicomonas sp. SCSIO W0465]|uniref:hypothetical protein n=1 Tax=Endozoicomonas sp. SCSIO W0465 TaxID=2918516 RepID=UPI0020756E01|nr:hypothetical protein [Endozoicomonas sp. SCSIO W0465]USE34203.1 hypothetical protein MJO57_18775 [Endozoicomonas sp. SCSIO W0465]
MDASALKRYVVKQKVQTYKTAWLEEVFTSPCHREALSSYQSLTQEFPDSYFELTEEIQNITCLAFTAYKG